MDHYWLVERQGVTSSAYERNYFVVRGQFPGDSIYKILDSLDVRAAASADTNVMMYTTIREDSIYLEALYLSPVLYRDTIFVSSSTDSDSWLSEPTSFVASIKDSIIAFWDPCPFDRCPFRVVRFTGSNEYRRIPVPATVIGYRVSYDFSQFLFCIERKAEVSDSPRSEIVVYDPKLDSLYAIAGIKNCSGVVCRYTGSGPVFYTKESEGVENLWRHSLNTADDVKLTNYKYPKSIFAVELYSDRLRCLVYNKIPKWSVITFEDIFLSDTSQ